MTNEKKRMVPELRFRGFTDDWEQRKLGDIAEFLNGRAYKQKELLDSGKYPVLRVGNFNTNDKWYYSDLELPAKNYANKGDLLYTWATAFGPHIWTGQKVIYHYHIWKVEPIADLSKDFTVHLLDADQAQMTNSLNGSTMVHITKGTMESKVVSIPSVTEQRRITRLLNNFDDTIALHQRKHEALLKLKEAYLQKLFPEKDNKYPVLRFAGFTDDWEQRKLGEIVSMIDGDRGSNYPHESDFLPDGEIVFLDTRNVRPEGFNLSSRKYISEKKNQQLRSGLLKTGDFVMTIRGTLGNVAYYGNNIRTAYPKMRINSAMLILRPTGRVSNGLLLSLLRGNLITTFLKKDHVGSAQPHITKRDFSKMLVTFPSDGGEQNAIGSFLQILSQTIALHQRKLYLLKEQKKGFLQKMFV